MKRKRVDRDRNRDRVGHAVLGTSSRSLLPCGVPSIGTALPSGGITCGALEAVAGVDLYTSHALVPAESRENLFL